MSLAGDRKECEPGACGPLLLLGAKGVEFFLGLCNFAELFGVGARYLVQVAGTMLHRASQLVVLVELQGQVASFLAFLLQPSICYSQALLVLLVYSLKHQ